MNTERLAELRGGFDAAFAAPPPRHAEDSEALILIQAAGEALALNTRHIAGLARWRLILPVPSRIPELLGIAGIRGTLTPVYDLAALLGFPSQRPEPRWLALTGQEMAAALAFNEFEGQVDVPRTCLYVDRASPAGRHMGTMARIGSSVRAVIDVPAILDAIRRQAGLTETDKEQR